MKALEDVFPEDPPRFMQRGPHGYADVAVIRSDLKEGGFDSPEIVTVTRTSRAATPLDAVTGYATVRP